MIKVKEINWLSESAKEAEVTISDGTSMLTCFSQPFNYDVNDVLDELLYCYDAKNVMKSLGEGFIFEKQNDAFAYFLRGVLTDSTKKLVKVGNFMLSLEDNPIPKDLVDGDTIEFTVRRIDIY